MGTRATGDASSRATDVAATGNLADIIAAMEALHAPMAARDDANRHFLELYLRVTRALAREIAVGGFVDTPYAERWTRAMAGLYYGALEAWLRGERPPAPWGVAFATAKDPAIPPLRHVLLGMNAHVNYDLTLSLLQVIGDDDFADPQMMQRRIRDHRQVNVVLLSLVDEQDEALTTANGGKSFYERLKTPLERRATGHFLQEARAKCWANARLIAAARARGDGAEERRLIDQLAERSAAKLAQLLHGRDVLLRLWVTGFGVTLDGAQVRKE